MLKKVENANVSQSLQEVLMSNEDKLEYSCQHCGGEISVDADSSNSNWKVYKCLSCDSKAPLSHTDLMDLVSKS